MDHGVDRVPAVGVSSFEELAAALIPGYECCTFRGSMLALNANTGEIIWSFGSVGACNAGPAIVDVTVYWGSGYGAFGALGDNKFYAFSVE